VIPQLTINVLRLKTTDPWPNDFVGNIVGYWMRIFEENQVLPSYFPTQWNTKRWDKMEWSIVVWKQFHAYNITFCIYKNQYDSGLSMITSRVIDTWCPTIVFDIWVLSATTNVYYFCVSFSSLCILFNAATVYYMEQTNKNPGICSYSTSKMKSLCDENPYHVDII